MLPEEMAKVETRLLAARAKLLATVDNLDEAAWEWRPDDGRWSIRLVLAHVGASQWGHFDVARRLAVGEPIDLPDFDLDTWNEARVADRAGWSTAQVLADMDDVQQETLSFLRGLEPGQLAHRGIHPVFGETTVGQVLRVIALHDGLHRKDILQLLREMEGQ